MTYAAVLWRTASIAIAVAFVAIWQLVADFRLVSPAFLPSPLRTWASLVRGFGSGDLATKFGGTCEHMFFGWLAASVVGVALGAAIGSSDRMRTYVAPSLDFIRPLPVSALIPVAIALFGLTKGMALAVIAFGSIWPMLLATVHGFAAVEPRFVRVIAMSRHESPAYGSQDRIALGGT